MTVSIIRSGGNSSNRGGLPAAGATIGKKDCGGFARFAASPAVPTGGATGTGGAGTSTALGAGWCADEFVARVVLSVALSELFGVSVAVGVFAGAGAVTAAFATGDDGASSAGASDVISRGPEDVGFESWGFSVAACVLPAGLDGAAAASNISSALSDKFAEKIDFLEVLALSLS